MYLPLHIDLRGRKVLIIGAGGVGNRRVKKLLEAGARVTVIDRKNVKTKNKKNVKVIQKNLSPCNLPSFKGYFLVIASTNNEKLNAAIARKAKLEGCLINRADYFRDGNVIFPAVVKTSLGVISFSTLGKSPQLSKRVKKVLEREFSKH